MFLLKFKTYSNSFSKIADIFFSCKNSAVFIKGVFGIIIVYLPSFYYIQRKINSFKLIFISDFYYKSFVSHIFNYYIMYPSRIS